MVHWGNLHTETHHTHRHTDLAHTKQSCNLRFCGTFSAPDRLSLRLLLRRPGVGAQVHKVRRVALSREGSALSKFLKRIGTAPATWREAFSVGGLGGPGQLREGTQRDSWTPSAKEPAAATAATATVAAAAQPALAAEEVEAAETEMAETAETAEPPEARWPSVSAEHMPKMLGPTDGSTSLASARGTCTGTVGLDGPWTFSCSGGWVQQVLPEDFWTRSSRRSQRGCHSES